MSTDTEERDENRHLLPVRMTPIHYHDRDFTPQENIALHMDMETYVSTCIQEADRFALNNNPHAATGALAQAVVYMDFLERAGKNPEPDPDEPSADETEPAHFSTREAAKARERATKELQAALERHDQNIHQARHVDWNSKDGMYPGNLCAIRAFSTTLNKDIEELRKHEGTNRFAAEGHAQAAHIHAVNIKRLRRHLTEHGFQRPRTIPRSTVKSINQAAAAAIRNYEATAVLVEKLKPLHLHPGIAGDPDVLEAAEDALNEMTSNRSPLMLKAPVDEEDLQEYLMAMDDWNRIYLKRLSDEYPKHIKSDEAGAIEVQLRLVGEAMQEREPVNAGYIIQATNTMLNRAYAELHTTPDKEIVEVCRKLAAMQHTPHEYRRTVEYLLDCNRPLVDHYTALMPPGTRPTMGTPQQTDAVIESALNAGLQPGPLRELCTLMEVDPDDYGIPEPPMPNWDMVEELLNAATALNIDIDGAMEVMEELGTSPNEPEAAEWLDANFQKGDSEDEYDDDDDDDQYGDDDDDPDREDDDEQRPGRHSYGWI